jgi:hypothetical protein
MSHAAQSAAGTVAFFSPADKHGRESDGNLGRGLPPLFCAARAAIDGQQSEIQKIPVGGGTTFKLRDNVMPALVGAHIAAC